jgi:hypothetical protein
MALFSERYGYTKPSDVIIREQITPEIENAICSCYDRLSNSLSRLSISDSHIVTLEKYLWVYFLNKREAKFYSGNGYFLSAIPFFEDQKNQWYLKLNLIEFIIRYLDRRGSEIHAYHSIMNNYIGELNSEFKRHNFAYRIVDKKIVEITSENEIVSIETAIADSTNNIRLHLNKALELYSLRPYGDYRNSIKESISAVEAYCREKTNEETLGKSLNKLESLGITIPKMLKVAFDKLYAYTNQPDTGIRHALMDDEGKYTPSNEEALFMLVSCSSFLNYLNAKMS